MSWDTTQRPAWSAPRVDGGAETDGEGDGGGGGACGPSVGNAGGGVGGGGDGSGGGGGGPDTVGGGVEEPPVWSHVGTHILSLLVCIFVGIVLKIMILTTTNLYDDMVPAAEVERPIRTRSDLADIPIIGYPFQLVCDIKDVIGVNSQFMMRYAVWIPALCAAPGAVVAVKALLFTRTAALAFIAGR